jgi:hypothetical protein
MDTAHQRFLPLLALPLAWGTWRFVPYVDPWLGAALLASLLVFLLIAVSGPTPKNSLPYQSWTLWAVCPLMGWAAALCTSWAGLAFAQEPDTALSVGVLVGAVVAGLAFVGRIGARLAAPALDGTAEQAAADVGLAYALHGVEPCDVLVAMDGDTVFYVPPAKRSQDHTLTTALEWAAGRTNTRQVGRRWPPAWERHSRMEAITRQSAQMLHLIHGRWGANRPVLTPTTPTAHALLAAAGEQTKQGYTPTST